MLGGIDKLVSVAEALQGVPGMQFIFNKRSKGDIELPAQGRRDPRLPRPAEKPDVMGAFKQAGKGLQQLRSLTASSRSPSKR